MSGELIGQLSTASNLCELSAEVAQRKLGIVLQPHTRAIAVIPRLRRVHLNFLVEFQLGRASQRLAQDLRLETKLGRVVDVLILAAAAAPKVGALRS